MFEMKIKKLKKSKIKLEEFNCCPGKEDFMRLVKECGVKILPVDLLNERKYQTWKNEDDTAVIMIRRQSSFLEMLDVVEFVKALAPNEFNYTLTEKGNAVFRLWWD